VAKVFIFSLPNCPFCLCHHHQLFVPLLLTSEKSRLTFLYSLVCGRHKDEITRFVAGKLDGRILRALVYSSLYDSGRDLLIQT